MKAMMLDLETMGKHSNAAITQIGACIFDRETAEIQREFTVNVSLDDCMRRGLTVDASTIEFWMKQPQKNWMEGEILSLEKALGAFWSWCKSFPADMQEEYKWKGVWCHATFDAPILFNAYHAIRENCPFRYQDVRDLRTLIEEADYERPNHNGEPHVAIEDCRYQVNYAVEALNILKRRTS